MEDLDLRCKKCTRYLGLKAVRSIISEIRCPDRRCRAINKIKVVSNESSIEDIHFKFPALTKK